MASARDLVTYFRGKVDHWEGKKPIEKSETRVPVPSKFLVPNFLKVQRYSHSVT